MQLGASFFTFFKMQLRVKRRKFAQLSVIARYESFLKIQDFYAQLGLSNV